MGLSSPRSRDFGKTFGKNTTRTDGVEAEELTHLELQGEAIFEQSSQHGLG
jgi:hypothetical protein